MSQWFMSQKVITAEVSSYKKICVNVGRMSSRVSVGCFLETPWTFDGDYFDFVCFILLVSVRYMLECFTLEPCVITTLVDFDTRVCERACECVIV